MGFAGRAGTVHMRIVYTHMLAYVITVAELHGLCNCFVGIVIVCVCNVKKTHTFTTLLLSNFQQLTCILFSTADSGIGDPNNGRCEGL